MKLAIISDMHLGYGYNTERKEDSFTQAEEALEKAIQNNVDAILLAGDIFDSRVPSQDVLAKSMRIFLKPLAGKSNLNLKYGIGKDEKEIPNLATSGTPVIAIHGTHERRGKGFTNPVQVLEKAGLLIHLHCNSIVLENESEKLAVHGMSGVPERYAKQVLDEWGPKPVPNAFNVFMLHQSISQYLYSGKDEVTLDVKDLPKDFNLIVDGHIHWPIQEGNFLIPGSTIITQMNKIEAEKKKGFYIVDTVAGSEFKELSTPRDFHYVEILLEKSSPEQVLEQIENELCKIESKENKPLVRINLKGSLDKGFEKADLDLIRLETKYRDKFLLNIGKGKISTDKLLERRELLEKLRSKKHSIDELGLEFLKKHLDELKYTQIFDAEMLLNLSASEDINVLYEKLKGMKQDE